MLHSTHVIVCVPDFPMGGYLRGVQALEIGSRRGIAYMHTLPAMKTTYRGRGGDLAWVSGLAQHVVVCARILNVYIVIYVSYEISLCHRACVCRPPVCTAHPLIAA